MALEHRQTLGQVVDRTLALCGDYRGERLDGDWFDRGQVSLVLKRLHLETAQVSGILKGTTVIPLLQGSRVYDLPFNCLNIRRVMLHGIAGQVLFPYSQQAVEMIGANLTEAGAPFYFYRDLLAHNQVGVIPTPDADGSTVDQNSEYGIVRTIQDADGNYIPMDGTYPGRFIRGVPITTVGGEGLIRGVISPYGNLLLSFERSPTLWEKENEYPDAGIPVFMHQAFRFGAAAVLLGTSTDPFLKAKAEIFKGIWRGWIHKLTLYSPITRSGGLMPV